MISRIFFALALVRLAAANAECDNPVAKENYLNVCRLREDGFRGSGGGVANPLEGETDETGKPYTCERLYEKNVSGCTYNKKESERKALESAAATQAPSSTAKTEAVVAKAETPRSKNAATPPIPPPRPTNDFTASTNENTKGAKDTNGAIEEVGRANEEIHTLAGQSADAAIKRADERVRATRSGSSSHKEAAALDKKLAEAAKASLKQGTSFPEEAANRANDKSIRKHLTVVSEASKAAVKLDREENRLSEQLAMLLKLAATTLNRGESMESVPSGPSAVSSGAAIAAEPASVSALENSAVRATASLSNDVTVNDRQGDNEQAGEKEPTASPDRRAAILAQRKSLRAQLKSKLGMLLAKDQAEAVAGASQFQEDFLTDSPPQAGGYEAAPVDNGLKSFLTESRREADAEFSMSDAASAASELRQNGENEIREMNSGILSVDSPSLFERITAVYRACLKRSCLKARG